MGSYKRVAQSLRSACTSSKLVNTRCRAGEPVYSPLLPKPSSNAACALPIASLLPPYTPITNAQAVLAATGRGCAHASKYALHRSCKCICALSASMGLSSMAASKPICTLVVGVSLAHAAKWCSHSWLSVSMRGTWFSFLPSVTAPGRSATCSHCCPASCALPFVCHMVWPLAHSALKRVWPSCQWADCTLKCWGHLGNNTSSCSRSFWRSFSNRCCCASPKPAMASWPLMRSWSMACCASSACAMRWLSLYFSNPSSEKGSSSSAASWGWSRRKRKRSTKNTSTG